MCGRLDRDGRNLTQTFDHNLDWKFEREAETWRLFFWEWLSEKLEESQLTTGSLPDLGSLVTIKRLALKHKNISFLKSLEDSSLGDFESFENHASLGDLKSFG